MSYQFHHTEYHVYPRSLNLRKKLEVILILSDEEKEAIESWHSQEKGSRLSDRLKAILLYSEGWSAAQISQALRIHQASIYRHVEDYQNGKIIAEYKGTPIMGFVD